jgi:alkanesulfonate monooxygenase SsuD/methylene tetrahydromethanopterin reductase-like flavin-dependent oxidoreductase (luciferase family)
LVTGNTYRNPTLLAKIITTLDVVSAGRAILGIGAGWFELEHRQLGFEFGTFTERFSRLEEALQILQPMIRGERPTFSGKWYTTESAMANPRYRDNIPIMIGGGGEKKTFAIAARSADHLNIIAGLDELPGKVDALAARCDEVGRDRSTLKTTAYLTLIIKRGRQAGSDPGRARIHCGGQPGQHRRTGPGQSARRRHRRCDHQPGRTWLHARRHHHRRRGTASARRSVTGHALSVGHDANHVAATSGNRPVWLITQAYYLGFCTVA